MMIQTNKFNLKKAAIFALGAMGFLIYSVGLFYSESHLISFQEKIQSDDEVILDRLISRALSVVKANDDIRNQLRTSKKDIAIEHYNNIANDYNSINQEIMTFPFLNDHPDLKKSFIEVNNEASVSLATTYELLTSKGAYREGASQSSSFISRYEALKRHPSITQLSFKSFNQSTIQFLMGIIGFSVLALITIFTLIRSQRKLNDLLVQKESELKTFLSVIDNMSEGVIVSDRFGFFTYYNQSALEI
ncbi:MAG: hypothetical protein H7Z71_09275, partial [Moraxellaceae bacterium]|nr:hypothetical protein [Pseudobdellovibrionaceae bacterium]